jgi:glycosyltransferase involved in cell wall biosynthesis
MPPTRLHGDAAGAIVYIAGQFPLRSETFVYREVRGLRQRGHAVIVVSLNEPTDLPDDCEDLYADRLLVYGGGQLETLRASIRETARHPLRALLTVLGAWRDVLLPGEPMSIKSRMKLPGQAVFAIGLAGRLRDRRVRHIHAHFAHAPTTLAMYAARQLGVPFSFTGHANDLFHRRALLKRKLRRAAFVSCISEWHRSLYRSIVPRDDRCYPVIRCGVDVAEFVPVERRADGNAPLQVLTVCRLVEKKGVDTLLRALHSFDPTADRWRLTVAGDGPQRTKLESLASELGIASSVRFLGAVGNEHVRRLLGECDVFALPCRVDSAGDKDGIPVVLMEAMACGVPVIAGDLEAIRELIEDGKSGLLVDGTCVEPTKNAVARLFDAPIYRAALAYAGRLRVESEFSLQTTLDRLELAFE